MPFTFDEHGSSHQHRENAESKKFICSEHIDTFRYVDGDIVISLLPNAANNLDYYNNQFYKQEKGQIISYLQTNYSEAEISNKLANNWGINTGLTSKVPLWVLREWCSFWITDSWARGYNRNSYSAISTTCIDVEDLIGSFDCVFLDLATELNLTVTVDWSIIKQTHLEFCQRQRFHNAQILCENWVDDVINDKQSGSLLTNPTLFDEAYIQHLFRTNGYEIYCDGLDALPVEPTKMKALIYSI